MRKRQPLYVDDTFITNTPAPPRGMKPRHPRGLHWEYWLFCRKGGRRFIKTIRAGTKREANRELREFMKQPGVLLVHEKSRRPVRVGR